MVARNPEKDIWEEKPKDMQKWNKGLTNNVGNITVHGDSLYMRYLYIVVDQLRRFQLPPPSRHSASALFGRIPSGSFVVSFARK
jgi:hypothetical protein